MSDVDHIAEWKRSLAANLRGNWEAAECVVQLARIVAKEEIMAMGMKAAETDRREANLCTCGAAGSGEEHEEWCEAELRDANWDDWIEVGRLRAALREVRLHLEAHPAPSQRVVNSIAIIDTALSGKGEP